MLNTATARVAAAFTMLALNFQELRENDSEEGQALVEYGLILALVAVLCIVALTALSGNISGLLDKIGLKLK